MLSTIVAEAYVHAYVRECSRIRYYQNFNTIRPHTGYAAIENALIYNRLTRLTHLLFDIRSIHNTSDSVTEQIRSFLINNNTILSHETAHIMLSQAHRLAVKLWCLLTIQSIITSLRIKC